MKRFIEGEDRSQSTLFPEHLDDYVGEDNPVRVVDVFVDALELGGLGFERVVPQATGRPGYHPSILLKLYIYGYLNRAQSSRRLEQEAGRNVEVMWLTGRLAPDHKTIAEFRKDHGRAIRKVCVQFVALCRRLDLFSDASVAIDGAKFKAVNARDKNFTRAKVKRRMAQIEESVARYLDQLDSADRQEPSLARTTKTRRLTEKIATLKEEMRRLGKLEARMLATPDQQISLSDPDARSMLRVAIGSGTAFLIAQLIDVHIFDRLRRENWWKAPVASSFAGSLVDTALFFSIAFAGTGLPWIGWGLGDFCAKLLMMGLLLYPFRLLTGFADRPVRAT